MSNRKLMETTPIAPLKIIAMENCDHLSDKVNACIVANRLAAIKDKTPSAYYLGYENTNYLVDYTIPRFGTGEAKAVINETIRGCDLFIIADVMNYSVQYTAFSHKNIKSADDHFQDLKRLIAAAKISKVRRISVIIPFLYEGRQHHREKLESLDCAVSLQELSHMGVENIITFDAHDNCIQNAIPVRGFDNFYTSVSFVRELFNHEPNLLLDSKHTMIIGPDEGGIPRAIYYANTLGVQMGMFYKRRSYANEEHKENVMIQYLGSSPENMDAIIIDDIISSGNHILDACKTLKEQGAKHVYLLATFGLFTKGLSAFDKAYENKWFDKIYTTNLIYCSDELLQRPYYVNVDLSKYISLIIDTINHDTSVNDIINPDTYVKELVRLHNQNKA